MYYREICKILGSFLFLFAAILVVPFLLAAYYEFFVDPSDHPQPHSTIAFAYTILVCLGASFIFYYFSRNATEVLFRREALSTAVLIWFLIPALGALPFIFSGTLSRFDQAYMEVTSGFTTTGGSVFEAKQYDPQTGKEVLIKRSFCGEQNTNYAYYGNINPVIDPKTGAELRGYEAISRALLFWRAFTQWLGGMGIIVLFVAFLPALGVGGKFLFQTESPGVSKEGFTPRIKETAFHLWKIYLGLTLIQIVLLLTTNSQMSLFDAVSLAFATISTGGLTIHENSIAYYHNSYTEWIIILFMFMGGINFALYYHILKGKIYRLFEPEFIAYSLIILAFSLFSIWQLWGFPIVTLSGTTEGIYSFLDTIRPSLFQVVSTQTSTGFFTANYDMWPMAVQGILLISMFLGGMAGSTSGGMKVIRIYILFQVAKIKIQSIFRPKTIKILRIGQKEIDNDTAVSVLCFFFIIIFFSTLGTFLYVVDGIDSETALSLSLSMVNNTGLGFRENGPTSSLAFLSPFSAYLSSFLMILGRLEFYAVLVLFLPAFWKES